MAERRMAQVVREGNRLRQVFLQAKLAGDSPADLCDFQTVREASAVMVVGDGGEDLRLTHQPAKSSGVDDPLPISLKQRAKGVLRLWHAPATALASGHGIRRKKEFVTL